MSRGLLDGEWVDAAAAHAPLLSEAFQFGLGAFTTIGVRNGRAFWLEDHAARLSDNLATYLADARVAPGWQERVQSVCIQNSMTEGAVKAVCFLDGGRVREWIVPRSLETTPFCDAAPVSLTIRRCDSRRGRALSRIKSLNYAEHWLLTRDARLAGRDDGLWIDAGGRVLEAGTANVFAVIDGRLVTPPVTDGLLPGVARARVVACVPDVVERSLQANELARAEEVFVTNAVRGAIAVTRIDDLVFAAPGPRTSEVAAALRKSVA